MVDNKYFWTVKPKNHSTYVACTVFDKSLEALQNEVEGTIEHVVLSEKLYALGIDSWINDEGKLINMPPTAVLLTDNDEIVDVIHGPICFTRYDSEGYTHGVTFDDIEILKNWWFNLPSSFIEYEDDIYMVTCIHGFVKAW